MYIYIIYTCIHIFIKVYTHIQFIYSIYIWNKINDIFWDMIGFCFQMNMNSWICPNLNIVFYSFSSFFHPLLYFYHFNILSFFFSNFFLILLKNGHKRPDQFDHNKKYILNKIKNAESGDVKEKFVLFLLKSWVRCSW